MDYLITGSTGLVGGMLVRRLAEEAGETPLTVILPVRNEAKARSRLEGYGNRKNVRLRFIECDICKTPPKQFAIESKRCRIIHCAAPTVSSYMISNPVETADTIVLGTKNMLELAKFLHADSVVYLSSMEVYGRVEDNGNLRREDELGQIDLTSPRSCYPLGKRMAEHYCHIYEKEYGVPVKIARLSQVFGKGVRSDDNRVFMQFSRAVLEKKDIILKTEGKSFGNYCGTEDAIQAVLTIMKQGKAGEAYNVVNEENTMRIREVAELVAKELAGNRIGVRFEWEDPSKTGYAPDTGLRLSGEKLRALGWKPTQGLLQMFKDVMEAIGR